MPNTPKDPLLLEKSVCFSITGGAKGYPIIMKNGFYFCFAVLVFLFFPLIPLLSSREGQKTTPYHRRRTSRRAGLIYCVLYFKKPCSALVDAHIFISNEVPQLQKHTLSGSLRATTLKLSSRIPSTGEYVRSPDDQGSL